MLCVKIALKEQDRALVFDLCVLDSIELSEDIGESLERSCEAQAQTARMFVPFEADRAKVAEAAVADHHEMRGVFFEFAEDMGGNDQSYAFALELKE